MSVPGASLVFNGGVVSYHTQLKHSLLGVDAELLAENGPVDPHVAQQMAEGARHTCAIDGRPADIGLATTGVAGPDPDPQGRAKALNGLSCVSPVSVVSSMPLSLSLGSNTSLRCV